MGIRRDHAAVPLAVVALLTCGSCDRRFDPEAAAAEIENRYGVRIQYEIGPDFLPESWTAPEIGGRAEEVEGRELERILRSLPDWLDKYPAGVIRDNLSSIRVVGYLEFFGFDYAGTNIDRTIYLANGGERSGYDDRFLEGVFHHELSSILLTRYPFPFEDWLRANPPGVDYNSPPDQPLEMRPGYRSTEGTDSVYRLGLLTEYGITNLENDLNLYAEIAFTHPARMRRLTQEYPAIREKFSIFRRFLTSISPEFDQRLAALGYR